MMALDDTFQARIAGIENLVRQLKSAPESPLRASALELVQSLLELHGASLERLLELVAETGAPGQTIIDDLARDPLVASLLLLYDLHPADFETRVQQALAQVRPYLQSHGGNVELLGVADGVVRLRLQGSCNGCASSAATIQQTIEQALYEAAPDLQALEIAGATNSLANPANGLVQLERRA